MSFPRSRARWIAVVAAATLIATGVWAARTPRAGKPRRAPETNRDWLRIPSAELPEHASVTTAGGVTWIGAHDLARLLGATKFWRADLRKLELRVGGHRLQLTADNPFVLIDDHTLALGEPIRLQAGQLQAPVALVDSLPRDTTFARLVYDERRGLVFRVPAEGLVRTPIIENDSLRVRILFPVDRPEDVAVIGRDRAHFRIRFGGFFVGALPDSLPPGGLLRAMRPIPSVAGTAFELSVGPAAQGFRLEHDPERNRVELEIATNPDRGPERFAPDQPGPRPIRVIVVDAGHGGSDAGVVVNHMAEKHLTLALARSLEGELERRLGARVVLTRTDDRVVSAQERAERANRARADLVLSLHFDGAPAAAARGVTAFCPPATFGGGPEGSDRGTRTFVILPWRDVAVRHAVRSRQLTEAVLSALELRGLGPARLREVVPTALLGINAPGVMLECGMLTSDADRARIAQPRGIPDLAQAIAAGIDAYAKAE